MQSSIASEQGADLYADDKGEFSVHVMVVTDRSKVLDILEVWLSSKGYTYLRLDGGTGVEERQYVCERFNRDERVDVFVASSRSGGVGIKWAFRLQYLLLPLMHPV